MIPSKQAMKNMFICAYSIGDEYDDSFRILKSSSIRCLSVFEQNPERREAHRRHHLNIMDEISGYNMDSRYPTRLAFDISDLTEHELALYDNTFVSIIGKTQRIKTSKVLVTLEYKLDGAIKYSSIHPIDQEWCNDDNDEYEDINSLKSNIREVHLMRERRMMYECKC